MTLRNTPFTPASPNGVPPSVIVPVSTPPSMPVAESPACPSVAPSLPPPSLPPESATDASPPVVVDELSLPQPSHVSAPRTATPEKKKRFVMGASR
jgi:hypothetical protein